jgi:hypothetical protein
VPVLSAACSAAEGRNLGIMQTALAQAKSDCQVTTDGLNGTVVVRLL